MILVTGATGFIGRSLSRLLQRNHREFVCLTRPEGDLTRPETIASFFEKYPIRQVVHLAARLLGNDENLFQRDNVQATENLIAACRKVPLERFLFVSSGDVLSSYEGPYARSKKAAERKVMQSGLPYTILRPFRVLGAGDQSFGRMAKKMKRSPFAAFINSGAALWQPLFVEDVSRAILQALDSPQAEGKTYELGGQDKISYPDFLNLVREHVNPRCKLIYLPPALCFFILKTIRTFYPAFPLSVTNLQNMLENKVCDYSAAIRDFGYQPTPLKSFIPSLLEEGAGLEKEIAPVCRGPYNAL